MSEIYYSSPSQEQFKPSQIDVAGSSCGQGKSYTIFDSKRSIFGIFSPQDLDSSPNDSSFLAYDSLIKNLDVIKKSSPIEIKNIFSSICSKSNHLPVSNNTFGLVLPNNSSGYSVFIMNDGHNSVNLFHQGEINKLKPTTTQSSNKTELSLNFYSLSVTSGDILFLATPYSTDISFDQKISNFLHLKQQESARNISRGLTKVISSKNTNNTTVVVKV